MGRVLGLVLSSFEATHPTIPINGQQELPKVAFREQVLIDLHLSLCYSHSIIPNVIIVTSITADVCRIERQLGQKFVDFFSYDLGHGMFSGQKPR